MLRKIALIGLGFEKPEIIEAFVGSEQQLRARLVELQKGYCEDERPVLHEFENGGATYLEAMSDSDYSHIALLNKQGEK